VKTLGDAAEESQDDIVASDPVIKDVRDLSKSAKPGANQLDKLLGSLDKKLCVQRNLGTGECTSTTTGLRSLMDFIFNTSATLNGFDSFGHYLRTFALVTTCTELTVAVLGACDARFGTSSEFTSAPADASDAANKRRARKSGKSQGRTPRAGQGAPESLDPDSGAPSTGDPESSAGGDGSGELKTPGYGRSSSDRSQRAGKELLRFLLEDGS
jgi:hypothetical protein